MSAIPERLVAARRPAVYAIVLGLGLAVALPFVGRWEGGRDAARQNAAMAAVWRVATSDGLISPRLTGYRLAWAFDCLVYSEPGDKAATNALEACFGADGRLVETIDRRYSNPRFATLQEQPSRATVHVPVRRILAALVALHAFTNDARLAGVSPDRGTLPIRFNDTGVRAGRPPIR